LSSATIFLSNDDNIIIKPQSVIDNTQKVYNLTIEAGKSSAATTRALNLEPSGAIKAIWQNGDEVTVLKSGAPIGTLTASNISADGQNCTFKGTITGEIAANDNLMLVYHDGTVNSLSGVQTRYSSQTGTLASAQDLDNASALVTVKAVNGTDITIKESSANFYTWTAMLKITMTTDGATPINAESLIVKVNGDRIFTIIPTAATYQTNGDGILYLALPYNETLATAMDNSPVNLVKNNYNVEFSAVVGDYTYKANKTGYTFEGGKYYRTSLTMKKFVDIENLTRNFEAKHEDILTGTLAGNYKISIAHNATVTLNNATITGTNNKEYNWAGITCNGNATIILADGSTNRVKGFHKSYPGIFINKDYTLTIQGETNDTGTLYASSNGNGCGIGGGFETSCGSIKIERGTIIAEGGEYAAAIGSGGTSYGSSSCGDISITAGNITAEGGYCGAGIGGGSGTSCGDITISGGTVKAKGGSYASGIGTGIHGYCRNINITTGVTRVTAIKGESNDDSYITSCIGKVFKMGSSGGTCESVKIGGVEHWTKSDLFYDDDSRSYLLGTIIIYPN